MTLFILGVVAPGGGIFFGYHMESGEVEFGIYSRYRLLCPENWD
jgi:hypothetical protein